jgi:hypothetical protein
MLKTAAARAVIATAAVIGVALLGSSSDKPTSADLELVAGKTTSQAADDKTRRKIVETAEAEMNSKRNYEKGDNCNSYSPGGKCQAWCADFAKYVWDKGGAKTDSVNSAAKSFRDYGQKNKTWKNGASAKNVKPGDAVTYRLNDKNFDNDHVGIVTKVDKKTGKITVISGNSSDKIRKITIDPKKSQVTGYSSPVSKKSTKPKTEKKGEKTEKKGDKKTQQPQPKKKSQDNKPGQVEPQEPIVLSEAQVTIANGVVG